jgi:hypothetical protein
MSIWSMMNSTATLKRPKITRDAEQGVTQDPFTTIATGLACSYQEKSSSVEDTYGQRNTVVHATLYFAQDPGCEANDRFEVTRPTQSGTEVVFVNVKGEAEPVDFGVQWEVEVERIRQPS